jgi:hypothetical protein
VRDYFVGVEEEEDVSDGWLAKLRQDQRAAKADVAVIVSQALPKGVKQFELIDGVYVVSPQCVRPVAEMLRGLLVEVAGVRLAAEGGRRRLRWCIST